jgi:hypothetical protein
LAPPPQTTVLLQHAQARRGLARVDQLRLGAGDGVDEARGFGGDGGEMLDHVERRAFDREHALRPAGDRHQLGLGREALPVRGGDVDLDRRIVAAKTGGCDLDAGQREGLARVHVKGAACLGVDHGERGEVAVPDVLGEPEIDQPADGEKVEHQSMIPKRGHRFSEKIMLEQ